MQHAVHALARAEASVPTPLPTTASRRPPARRRACGLHAAAALPRPLARGDRSDRDSDGHLSAAGTAERVVRPPARDARGLQQASE